MTSDYAGCPCLPAVGERRVRSATDQLTALRSRCGYGWGVPCRCSWQCAAAAAVRQHAAMAETLWPLPAGEWLAWQGQTTLLGQRLLLRGRVRRCVCHTADLDASQAAMFWLMGLALIVAQVSWMLPPGICICHHHEAAAHVSCPALWRQGANLPVATRSRLLGSHKPTAALVAYIVALQAAACSRPKPLLHLPAAAAPACSRLVAPASPATCSTKPALASGSIHLLFHAFPCVMLSLHLASAGPTGRWQLWARGEVFGRA